MQEIFEPAAQLRKNIRSFWNKNVHTFLYHIAETAPGRNVVSVFEENAHTMATVRILLLHVTEQVAWKLYVPYVQELGTYVPVRLEIKDQGCMYPRIGTRGVWEFAHPYVCESVTEDSAQFSIAIPCGSDYAKFRTLAGNESTAEYILEKYKGWPEEYPTLASGLLSPTLNSSVLCLERQRWMQHIFELGTPPW